MLDGNFQQVVILLGGLKLSGNVKLMLDHVQLEVCPNNLDYVIFGNLHAVR